ncbi:MAG: glycosyltransferase, partial [Candidatus Nomurabacteria bacterium]|nr:glycosyltransferase [Candidatus Nomurabacteria bacterium]
AGKIKGKIRPDDKLQYARDVLFINGSTLPHPTRYRTAHQAEQLNAGGLSSDKIDVEKLNLGMIKYYRAFVFFRAPLTDTIRQFIATAKKFNKTIFFDIDDLVFDQKFTDTIEFVANMSQPDKAHYDDGVKRIGQTMKLCDYGITTTQPLAREMKKFAGLKEVFVNKNTASDEMLSCSDKAYAAVKRPKHKITLGYFSGSITHNEDFEMILPAILRIMEKYSNVYLHVGGILDVPEALQKFAGRLSSSGFIDWRNLPAEIAKCDINLAPLAKKTIFNAAKSENKWTEAALVRVPTVATDFGAFKDVIKNAVNGILTDNNKWFEAIESLVLQPDQRRSIGAAAYETAKQSYLTTLSGQPLAEFVYKHLAPSVAFVTPSIETSGGMNVIFKHAEILQSSGYDVTVLNNILKKNLKKYHDKNRAAELSETYNMLLVYKTKFQQLVDNLVATHWATLDFVKKYDAARRRSYLVQNHEVDFQVAGDKARLLANATYCDRTGVKYLTISKWCQKWLEKDYKQNVAYAPNGLWTEFFKPRQRDFSKGKIKILIEGDSRSAWKGVDESFKIANQLDPKKFEINYLSNGGGPKSWYRVDNFYHKLPYSQAVEIYAANDILIKSSVLESFSYPPLDMMATGGFAVVAPNDGNAEYLEDAQNCLLYEQGNIEAGLKAVLKIAADKNLRAKLAAGGLKTATSRAWDKIEPQIVELYK